MPDKTTLTRRNFLKFAGLQIAAAALPGWWLPGDEELLSWPTLRLEQLPARARAILARTPRLAVGPYGYLRYTPEQSSSSSRVPLHPTQWNRENRQRWHRLNSDLPWGIVLHWYGERDNFDRRVRGYLRGFDSLREVDGEEIRTSAHFLVGDGLPASRLSLDDPMVGVLQTQAPDKDGTPFLAAHLHGLDLIAHAERRQYFVRAHYTLGAAGPVPHALLQDLYDGPLYNPNTRTIGIEMCGYDFETLEHTPSVQQTANALALVCALMKRYRIPVSALLGHCEIQLGKSDPGKKFMTLMRYLVGIKALLDGDRELIELVFTPFLPGAANPAEAVARYFCYVRDYLSLVGVPRQVYDWESASGYWLLQPRWQPGLLPSAPAVRHPLGGQALANRYLFLQPESHEGLDLSHAAAAGPATSGMPVQLAADGECLYLGASGHSCQGQTAIFRHYRPDGTQLLTIYGHLHALGDLRLSGRYPAGAPVGLIQSPHARHEPYLHFAVAYGATWDAHLQHNPQIPLNAGSAWIRDRYLAPAQLLALETAPQPPANHLGGPRA